MDKKIDYPKYLPGQVILSKALNLYVIKEVHIVLHDRGMTYRYYVDGNHFFTEPDIKALVKVEYPT